MAANMRALAAAIFLAVLFPRGVEALRVVPGTFQISPAVVDLSRTITVTLVLEEESGVGGMLGFRMQPVPAGLVRLVDESAPWMSCTSFKQTRGRWVYRAVAPGNVNFNFTAKIAPCDMLMLGGGREVSISGSSRLNTPKIWSQLDLSPRIAAPGDNILLELLVRNDGEFSVRYRLPRAQAELPGSRGGDLVEMSEEAKMDSPGKIREGEFELAPGESIRARWPILARSPGRLRFLITGAGMVAMSPALQIRHSPVLECILTSLVEESAAGASTEISGIMRSRGEPAISEPRIYLSWTPSGAARLVSRPASTTVSELSEGGDIPVRFVLDLLEPGSLVLTVTAEGREADTGKRTFSEPASLSLRVLPPPDLELDLELGAGTAMVGSEVPFTLKVINRGRVTAASMSPSFAVRTGSASFRPLSPLFLSVPSGTTGVFRGRMVPEERGFVELVAQISSQGQLGGVRAVAASKPAGLLAVPAPLIELYCLEERVHPGSGPLRFLLRNGGSAGFTLSRADLKLAGDGYTLNVDLLEGKSLSLSPGQESLVSVEVEPPPAADPYWLMAGLQFAGDTADPVLGFSGSMSQRPATLICPRERRFTLVEPEGAFMPPLDPLLQIEWTTTVAGKCGLAVVTAEGRMVRTLRPPDELDAGIHSARWYGLTEKGGLVKPGSYLLRLAGPASGNRVWPDGAVWTIDRPVEVQKP